MPKRASPPRRIAQCRHGYKDCTVRGYHSAIHDAAEDAKRLKA